MGVGECILGGKKDKDKQIVDDKGGKRRGWGEVAAVVTAVELLLYRYKEAGQYRQVEIALTLNTAPVSRQGSINNELRDLGELVWLSWISVFSSLKYFIETK